MNFLETAAEIVQYHPVTSIGAAVSVVLLWKAAKAGLRRFNAHLDNRREIDAMINRWRNEPVPTLNDYVKKPRL